jgi:hypothetical protein
LLKVLVTDATVPAPSIKNLLRFFAAANLVKQQPVSALRWVVFASIAFFAYGILQYGFLKPLIEEVVSHAVVNSMNAWMNRVSNSLSAPMIGWELRTSEVNQKN